MNCTVVGKPAITSIQWSILQNVNGTFKSTNLGFEPDGKLTRHTVKLEWNTNDMKRRKAGNKAVVTCVADNGQGRPLNYSMAVDVQCKSMVYQFCKYIILY